MRREPRRRAAVTRVWRATVRVGRRGKRSRRARVEQAGRRQTSLRFRRIVERLANSPGLRPEDVFINLVEVAVENWSFGHGIAQYAKGAVPEPTLTPPG